MLVGGFGVKQQAFLLGNTKNNVYGHFDSLGGCDVTFKLLGGFIKKLKMHARGRFWGPTATNPSRQCKKMVSHYFDTWERLGGSSGGCDVT